MDIKEFRGLMEAYSEVYAPQEVDEGLRSAVKRLLGGGKKEAEAPKPESRGEQLRKKYNVGPEKSDTSAKRQILNRSRARAERDERDYGNSKYSKSVAQKSKEAHDRYLKAGYSKYGADDARGSGNKARKRAAALNREEFDWLVNSLLDEGYDLSTYTVEEFYDFCCEESEQLDELSDRKLRAYLKKSEKSHQALNKKWDQGTATYKDKYKSIGHEIGQERALKRLNKEELDIFDVVLEFLQVEGLAETLEEAEWMMANLLDKEAIDIIFEASCEDDDEKEMKKGKKSKKEEDDEDEEEEDDELSEASYSAKAARAGKDIGKPGKAFAKIAKSAAKRYGSKERGEKVAGAVLAKLRREEVEQLDELSDRKMRAYIKKSQKSHAAINKKWDQGTATEKEKLKSIGHEIGQERAYKKMDKRAGR